MDVLEEFQNFSVDDLATVRLLQLFTYARDLEASEEADRQMLAEAQQQEIANVEVLLSAPSKRTVLDELVASTVGWAEDLDLPSHLAELADLQLDGALADCAVTLLGRMAECPGRAQARPIILEAITSTEWPKGSAWAVNRFRTMAEGAGRLDPTVTGDDVESLFRSHKRACKRLRKDSIAPGAQVGLGAFMATAALLSGGAANAVGTAIGTHVMGYSGAAATSAGLAALGGGSLASGGLGMAGGALLVTSAAHVASSASRSVVGNIIAKQSSGAFIHELGKLDVRAQVDPELGSKLLPWLKVLERSLVDEWNATRPTPSARRGRITAHLRNILDDPSGLIHYAKSAMAELPPKEERNLATSVRAVQYEIRYLESPEWKRTASMVPRAFGTPAVARVLDVFDSEPAQSTPSP